MSFLDRLQDSITRLWEYVPALFGAAVILTVGFVLARLIQRAVQRTLRRVHLNEALQKGGVTSPLDPYGVPLTPSRVVGNVVFWVVIFTAMLIAADTLGIDYLGQAFAELVSYVPSVIAAVVIVILGFRALLCAAQYLALLTPLRVPAARDFSREFTIAESKRQRQRQGNRAEDDRECRRHDARRYAEFL